MKNLSKIDVEQIGKSGATKNNIAKILNSFYLYCDQTEQSVGQWLSSHGYWESWITSWMTHNINPGDVCIDVGANYGYYTRIMEYLSGNTGTVYSIEANKDLCNLIDKSIKDYPIENAAKVNILNTAVSDKEEEVTLHIPPKFLGGSSIVFKSEKLPSNIPTEEWYVEKTVMSNKLDNLIFEPHINLIKMDIEGAEYLAWNGMKNILDKTDLLIVELGSYSPVLFIDQIYDKYNVTFVDIDGEEKSLLRHELNNLKDLVMAVLRKK